MQRYLVTGMSCAACSARVEKAVLAVDGVETCTVSLLTKVLAVEGIAKAEDVISAVTAAGYGACLQGDAQANEEDLFKDVETPKLIKRVIASVCFLLPLMYLSMGHTMFGFQLPEALADKPLIIAIWQMVLSLCVILINRKLFINGIKGAVNLSPNMDTLVSMGSAAAFGYSTAIMFTISSNSEALHGLYFESAAMILTLITVGKLLEARSKGKTVGALKALVKLSPKTATLYADGKETIVSIEKLKVGDIFAVKPGEIIAVDGIVIDGEGAVDESSLTGESVPIDKTVGDSVNTATVNKNGYLLCKATRVGKDTTLSQIIQTVSDAASTKAPIAKAADKVSAVFVPIVILISLICFATYLFMGRDTGFALARAISVLVISCPCALGLATPVAVMVGNGVAARNGILFKSSSALEQTGKAKIVVLDKTGTVTEGKPVVTDIICANDTVEEQLVSYAVSVESKSEHPLAKAIVALDTSEKPRETSGFTALSGKGIKCYVDGMALYGGNKSFVANYAKISELIEKKANVLSDEGKTVMFFALEDKLLGMIAVADTIKADSAKAIKELKDKGLRVLMLTGDNKRTAEAIAVKAGITELVAGVMPTEKAKHIENLKASGKTVMVGDGVNDAVALTAADVGIAIGAGSDIAIDAASVVLMKNSLSDVCKAISISKRTLNIIHQNLFWAFIYNAIGIPLAAGVFTGALGWQLNPMFAAVAMSLSSFCVVINALRLNLIVFDKHKKENSMKKTLYIKGMMCSHCEGRVKSALEAASEVESAVVNYKLGTAVLTLNADMTNEALKSLIEAQGYKLIDIK